jgi:hypothetical protein
MLPPATVFRGSLRGAPSASAAAEWFDTQRNCTQENPMSNQQKDTNQGAQARSDTTSMAGAQPVQGQSGKVGADIAGRAGTDAAAGATMGGDGGQGPRGQDTAGGQAGGQGPNPGTGAAVAGGTGLGEAASAGDTRTGTSSGEGASLTGGDPSSGKVPPPTNKGGASAA